MNWQAIEDLVDDNSTRLSKDEVVRWSEQLLSSVDESTKPLRAARVTYLMSILELRNEDCQEDKVLHYLSNLEEIFAHVVTDAEYSREEGSQAHLLYLRKLMEQYYHHLAVLADQVGANRVYQRTKRYRMRNHSAFMELQPSSNPFLRREQQLIKGALRGHYMWAGFLFAIAVYFAWSSVLNLTDVAMAKVFAQQVTKEGLMDMIQQVLLLGFSLSFIWAFARYQKTEA